MLPRILVVSPSFEDWIVNCLTFLSSWSTDKVTIFVTCISGQSKDEPAYNEFVLSQNWCFVPCDYLLPMDVNDCLPRIKYTDFYDQQHLVYKRYFPDLYLRTYRVVQSVVSKINPDWIVTCYGSLYFYNVLVNQFVRLLFGSGGGGVGCSDDTATANSNRNPSSLLPERVILYKDRPYADMTSYACNNTNWLGVSPQRVKTCPTVITQKLFLGNQYFPELMAKYGDSGICSAQEVLFCRQKINNPCIFYR